MDRSGRGRLLRPHPVAETGPRGVPTTAIRGEGRANLDPESIRGAGSIRQGGVASLAGD